MCRLERQPQTLAGIDHWSSSRVAYLLHKVIRGPATGLPEHKTVGPVRLKGHTTRLYLRCGSTLRVTQGRAAMPDGSTHSTRQLTTDENHQLMACCCQRHAYYYSLVPETDDGLQARCGPSVAQRRGSTAGAGAAQKEKQGHHG